MENKKYSKINLVSVIVLAYNNYDNLELTIKSILIQDYGDIEVILADDCSKNIDKNDIEIRIKSLISDKCSIKCLFNSENVGTVRNFNKAVSVSNGELIVPLSMGDRFADCFVISNIVAHFNVNKLFFGTSYICSVKDNKFKIEPSLKELEKLDDPFETSKVLLKHGLFFKGANTYYHKDLLKDFGYFDEKYTLYEDVPFLFKYLEKGFKVSVVPHICIIYVFDGISTKKTYPEALKKDRIRLFSEILKNNRYKRIHRYMSYRIRRHKYPDKKISTLLLYPEIALFNKIYGFLDNLKWHSYSSYEDVLKIVDKRNKQLKS